MCGFVGREGPYEYWHGNCIWCPWLAKFRQLDSWLHKPFTFTFPYPEREWENICALLETPHYHVIPYAALRVLGSTQEKEGGVLRGQAEWLKAENWVVEIPLQAGMCQTGTTSDRACSYVSSSPSNGGPWNFVGSLAKNLYGVLKENGNCWSVINNFLFFCLCESCFGKKIFQNMVCTYCMYKNVNDASSLCHTGWPKGISLPVCATPKEPWSGLNISQLVLPGIPGVCLALGSHSRSRLGLEASMGECWSRDLHAGRDMAQCPGWEQSPANAGLMIWILLFHISV